MDQPSAFSPSLRHVNAKSPTIIRVPRDEQLRIPRRPVRTGRRQAPVPLRPLRQPPAPPTGVPAKQSNTIDDHGLASPEIVDFEYGQENADLDVSRKKSQDSRRLFDQSGAYDILHYYLNSHTPNSPPTPSPREIPETAIVEFDFGFSPARSPREYLTQKSSPVPMPNRHVIKDVSTTETSTVLDMKPMDNDAQNETSITTRSGHHKTYSLFPVMQLTTTREPLSRTSSDTRVLSQSSNLATRTRPRKASTPISVRTRAVSGTTLPLTTRITSPTTAVQLPRRPQTVRIRTSTSSSSPPTTASISNSMTTPLRSSTNNGPISRWSEDTVTTLVSPTQSLTLSTRVHSNPYTNSYTNTNHKSHNSNSVKSTWTDSTARESIEPLYPALIMQPGEQLVSCFEDDDDDDESRPLRWKWKRSSGEKTERARLKKEVWRKSWSPRSSTRSRSTVVTVESLGGSKEVGWKKVFCCCSE